MADRNQANGRLGELERYAGRITDQLTSFDQNVAIVTENVQTIQKVLANDLGGEEAEEINTRFNKLLDQYNDIRNIIKTQYTNLSEKLTKYVTETRSNLQKALEEIDKLDGEIQTVIEYFTSSGSGATR